MNEYIDSFINDFSRKKNHEKDAFLNHIHHYFLGELNDQRMYPAYTQLTDWINLLEESVPKFKEFEREIIEKFHYRSRDLVNYYDLAIESIRDKINFKPWRTVMNKKGEPMYLSSALLLFPERKSYEIVKLKKEEDWKAFFIEESYTPKEVCDLIAGKNRNEEEQKDVPFEIFEISKIEHVPLEETIKPLSVQKYIDLSENVMGRLS